MPTIDGLIAQLGEHIADLTRRREVVRRELDAVERELRRSIEVQERMRVSPGRSTRGGGLTDLDRTIVACIRLHAEGCRFGDLRSSVPVVDPMMISNRLAKLKRMGVLTVTGRGKGTRWRVADRATEEHDHDKSDHDKSDQDDARDRPRPHLARVV